MNKFDRDLCRKPAQKFKALGHPVRLWIAQQLLDGEHCVSEFVEQTELDFSTVSQHLNVLRQNEVVVAEKRGKEVHYRLKCDCVRNFLACAAEHQRKHECQTLEFSEQ